MCTKCVNQKVHDVCKKEWAALIAATERMISASNDAQLTERLTGNLETFGGMMENCVPFPGMWSYRPATTPNRATHISDTTPSRLRILVIDDDPLILKSLGDTLANEGHFVVTANNGQMGIDTFHAAQGGSEPFAVVITDLGMPYVDGRQVASAIKAAAPATPVIMLTGWGQRLLAEGEVPPHVDRILSKPPKLRELREALAHFGQQGKP